MTTVYYVFFSNNSKVFLTQTCSFALEMLLLTSPFTKNINYIIPPLWYISAMMVVFPAFCCLCQCRHKHLIYLIAGYIPLFYYGYTNASCTLAYLHQVMRAFSGLCLGILIYAISNKFGSVSLPKWCRMILSFMEVGLLGLTVISTYKNWNINTINLLCLFLASILIFSNQSYSACMRVDFSFLGEISLVIYLFHWCVGLYIKHNALSYGRVKYFLYTMVLSVLVYLAKEIVRKVFGRIKMKALI